MADQQNNSGTSGFFKNIASKLPYQSVDLNRVLQDLNPSIILLRCGYEKS